MAPLEAFATIVRSAEGMTCVFVIKIGASGHGASRTSSVPCVPAARAADTARSIDCAASENCATDAPPGENPARLDWPVADCTASRRVLPQNAVHGSAL